MSGDHLTAVRQSSDDHQMAVRRSSDTPPLPPLSQPVGAGSGRTVLARRAHGIRGGAALGALVRARGACRVHEANRVLDFFCVSAGGSVLAEGAGVAGRANSVRRGGAHSGGSSVALSYGRSYFIKISYNLQFK